jgi:hypothetical protein
MNTSRKFILTLAGIVLISAAEASTWSTVWAAVRETPAIGCDDLVSPLHPDWRRRPSQPWQPCFGLCKEPFL